MGDQSYHKGHLYLYFGVTPGKRILFWPFLVVGVLPPAEPSGRR